MQFASTLSKTQDTCLLIAFISSNGVEEKILINPSRVMYLLRESKKEKKRNNINIITNTIDKIAPKNFE